jgi:hypothetical protein
LPQIGELAFLLRYPLLEFTDALGRAGVVHLGAGLGGAWCHASSGTSKHGLGGNVEHAGEPHKSLDLGVR